MFCGASDVEKTAVGRALGPGDGAGRGRAPGAGSELRGWCIVSNLPRAPGVLRAHPISTPASDGAPERAGDRLRDATGPVRADRLRDGHAAEDDHHGPERRRTAGPRGAVHGPAAGLPHGPARGPVHGPAAGHPDGLEGRDLHGLPAGARDALRDRSRTRSAARSARRRSRRARTTSAGRSARSATRTSATRSAARCRRPS